MKFEKIISDELDSCYAVGRIFDSSHDYLLVASETENACFSYDLNNNLERSIVWDSVGGTMSIIQIPGTLDFLATQRFYPGFDAKECRIVRGFFEQAGRWRIEEVSLSPYLHRFDLIESEGQVYFVGCTIANSKAFVEDWSDDGKVFVGNFNLEASKLEELRELPIRLKKNHGYYNKENTNYSLITAVEGIYKLSYPSTNQDWELTQLFDEETSDIVQYDVNQDGVIENCIIQGFHGDRFRIFNEDFSEEFYAYPEPTPFGHALWSGELVGRPVFVFGWRAGKKHFILLRYEGGSWIEEIIDSGVASSNCLAFTKDNHSYIFSANNGQNEVALYQVKED